jgi:hypothetical protein
MKIITIISFFLYAFLFLVESRRRQNNKGNVLREVDNRLLKEMIAEIAKIKKPSKDQINEIQKKYKKKYFEEIATLKSKGALNTQPAQKQVPKNQASSNKKTPTKKPAQKQVAKNQASSNKKTPTKKQRRRF